MNREEHPRLLGVDLGVKRIGIAVSDPLGLLAHPVLTFTRTREGAGPVIRNPVR